MTGAGVRCMLMRGGTSKGAFFLRDDLPTTAAERDALILRLVGSPDPRQIDGIGGGHPLTTKVAVVAASDDPRADVSYLFLQPSVDRALVSDAQNCGNILAGVGPFAVERGLVIAAGDRAEVRILMENTDSVAVATFGLRDGQPYYAGDFVVSGVPGHGAPIRLDFEDIAGSSCGALFPTGNLVDEVAGVPCTLLDNGMPVVVIDAAALGIDGGESPEALEANTSLRTTLEGVRLLAGPLMNLGDVAASSVPKLTIVSPPAEGGSLRTRTFIPHRCHEAIGVLGAMTVAVAARVPGTTAFPLVAAGSDDLLVLEHPTGAFETAVSVRLHDGIEVQRAGMVRTARKLMDGVAFPREY